MLTHSIFYSFFFLFFLSGPYVRIHTQPSMHSLIYPPTHPFVHTRTHATTIVLAAARFWDPLVFGSSSPMFNCSKCGRPYKTKYTLRRHERLECGLPALYKCRLCDYRAKHKHSVKQHFEGVHEKKNKFPLEVQLKE